MGHAMVIVSAAGFRKARTTDGTGLGVRRTWPVDRYVSNHKVLQSRLTGDLYLVTVTDDRLWLVAVLRSPRHDGAAWVSEPNVQPIVDLTPWAGDLRFHPGTGLDVDRMAASLQTPRGLIASDLDLLQGAIDRAAADRATPAEVEAAVVWVTAQLLGRTEDEVRNDPGRYAALHCDDGFVEDGLEELDWDTLELPAVLPSDLYGRQDFSLRQSRFYADSFRAAATTDVALRGLFRTQDGFLFGEQLAALITQRRLRPGDLDCYEVVGRIRAGETLVEAMTALFLLQDFERHRLEPGEYNETSPRWAEMLEQVQPPGLRAHLSFFFQSAEAARCTGAWFEAEEVGGEHDDEDDEDEDPTEDEPDDERVAVWWIGEGQGRCELVRLVDDHVPEVPPFTGLALLRRPPVPAGSRPPESGRSDEITSAPLHGYVLALPARHAVRRLLPGATDAELVTALTRLRKRDPPLSAVLESVDHLIQAGEARAALALVHACAGVVTPKHALGVEYHRCWALFTLRCWPEALESAERTLALWRTAGHVPESFVHNNLAWCALHVGQLDRALAHADRAVALDPENDRAQGTRADVLFALGRETEAFRIFTRLLRAGVDPEPTAAVSAHPKYRKLALEFRVPVELTDEETG